MSKKVANKPRLHIVVFTIAIHLALGIALYHYATAPTETIKQTKQPHIELSRP